MTLDIKKYLENLIKKESVISHFNVKVTVGKSRSVAKNIKHAILSEYGDSFLQDADYLIFFTKIGQWTKSDIEKVFSLTDRALGKDANKLSKADFLKLTLDSQKPDVAADAADSDEDAIEDDVEQSIETSSTKEIRFVKVTIK